MKQIQQGRQTNFFVIARGSVFEVIAILDILKPEIIEVKILSEYKLKGEEILKILLKNLKIIL